MQLITINRLTALIYIYFFFFFIDHKLQMSEDFRGYLQNQEYKITVDFTNVMVIFLYNNTLN